MKALFVSAVLVLAPALAFACGHDRVQTTSNCGEGQVWDDTKLACVPKPQA
jgi:hypothetical protein